MCQSNFMFIFLKYILSIIFFLTFIPTYSYGCIKYEMMQIASKCGTKSTPTTSDYNLCRDKVIKEVNNSQTCKNINEEQKISNEKKRSAYINYTLSFIALSIGYFIFFRSIFSNRQLYNKKRFQDFKNKMNNNKNSFANNSSEEDGKKDINKRLQKLKKLLDDNVITKEEYDVQRKKIIDDI